MARYASTLVPVLLITGPLGVGKSAVANEILERFCAANLPIAFIAVAALASEVLDRAGWPVPDGGTGR
jgi:putative protein kinase ArgK-like GTPase of G3E family